MFNFTEFTDELFKHINLIYHFETEKKNDRRKSLSLDSLKF